MGDRPERVEQANGQGKLSPHKHTGDPAQPARSYIVFIFGHMWSLPFGENGTWEPNVHRIYQSLSHISNTDSVYSRMLDMAMKEVDRDFWTSYLDDILTYRCDPWAHF